MEVSNDFDIIALGQNYGVPHWMLSKIESEARRLDISAADMLKILLADALDRRIP